MSCNNQTLLNTSCTVSNQCRIDKGLLCQSGTCLCDSSKPVWSSILSQCIKKYNYGETNCTADTDCVSGLQLKCVTNTNSTCNCPNTSQMAMCDCSKTYGNEYYWNGTSCTLALSYGQPCTNDYMCRTLTEGTFCNGTCTCETNSHFNSSNYCETCPTDWSFVNDICYYIFNSPLLCWAQAQLVCSNYGGKLIQFSNSTILYSISSLLNATSYWVGARGYPNGGGCGTGCPIQWFPTGGCDSCGVGGNSSCTIGCSSSSCISTCVCSSSKCGCGTNTTALNWCGGGSSSDHCLAYRKSTNCFINDPCTNTQAFICENL
jgi:hypothetical protein